MLLFKKKSIWTPDVLGWQYKLDRCEVRPEDQKDFAVFGYEDDTLILELVVYYRSELYEVQLQSKSDLLDVDILLDHPDLNTAFSLVVDELIENRERNVRCMLQCAKLIENADKVLKYLKEEL